ncbi:MAG TPA: hypothetical protein ENJ33_04030 [Thiothrix sp.]|nr:hypothetical protein [Thiothrix sp.]
MKILPIYINIAKRLSSIDPVDAGMVDNKTVNCQNSKHVSFIIKSTAGINMLTSKIYLLKLGKYLYGLNAETGDLYFDQFFLENGDGSFLAYYLSFDAYSDLERLAA